MSRRARCVCILYSIRGGDGGVVIPMTFTSIICTALVALDESVVFLTLTFIWLEISLFLYLHKKLIVLNAIIEWGNKIETIWVSIPKQRWLMSLINSMAMTAIRMKNLHDLFTTHLRYWSNKFNSIQFNLINYSDRFLGSEFIVLGCLFSFCVLFLYLWFLCMGVCLFFKPGQAGWTWEVTINATALRFLRNFHYIPTNRWLSQL